MLCIIVQKRFSSFRAPRVPSLIPANQCIAIEDPSHCRTLQSIGPRVMHRVRPSSLAKSAGDKSTRIVSRQIWQAAIRARFPSDTHRMSACEPAEAISIAASMRRTWQVVRGKAQLGQAHDASRRAVIRLFSACQTALSLCDHQRRL
jgi:hypothetical protein